jgi:hypothetical protein
VKELKTKEIYEELVMKRYGKLKEEDRKTNKAVRKLNAETEGVLVEMRAWSGDAERANPQVRSDEREKNA